MVERCARGDQAALGRLVGCYEDLAFNLAYRNLRNREDAEEIAAESFIRLWKTAGRFRGECSVKSHICRIVLNLCRDKARKQVLVAPPLIPTEIPGIDRVAEAILELEVEDRELLILYYLDELTYEEIGNSLDISYDVLKTRLVRARTRLRALLGVTQ